MSSFFTEALPYLFTGFSGAVLVWLLFWYLRSLLFYWRNGWDFSVDFGPPMAWGDEFQISGNEMRPREKVLWGYPVTLLICAYIIGMSVYFFWGPLRTMKWVMAVLAGLMSVCPAFAEDAVVGRASVVDGDTIELAGERIRLHGVDAPESWQVCEDGDGLRYRCGREAAMMLDRFLAASRPTRCKIVERDRYQRFVGVCFRADGAEVNRWLVESGQAVDWSRYSGGAYADAQDKARPRALGIWRGDFQLPCEARAQRMKQTPAC